MAEQFNKLLKSNIFSTRMREAEAQSGEAGHMRCPQCGQSA